MFFFKISIFFKVYSTNLKCPLHIASYALRIGVSVMELQGVEFVISHIFQRKRYTRTGNFNMYALGHFSRKRSQLKDQYNNIVIDCGSTLEISRAWSS